jgi:hypothetical protein
MFKIDGKQNIYISQGDSAVCNITVTNPEFPYEEYELKEGDTLVFTVRSTPKQLGVDEEPLIQKTLVENCIILEPQDTAMLEYGQYYYDVKLYFANGDINTIIPYITGNHYDVIADLPTFNVCEVVG